MNYLDQLSKERKELQDKELLPEWYTTGGWQLFKEKYMWAASPREQYEHIARTLAKHTDDEEKWYDKFFQLMWRGWLSPSTPVLANTGTDRGLPVSCSGSYVADSIDGFYSARRETALLTKYGFGTSAYLGDIRPRGSNISAGGKASGVLPVLKGFVQDSRDVSQAGIRRGSWAGYVPIDHADFDEVVNFLEKEPDDVNIGWNISDDFVAKLSEGDADARRRFSRALKAKMVTGKGYFWFPDKANRKLPAYYPIKHYAAQLCNEILLPSDEEHTYTCQPGHAPLIKRGVGLTTMDNVVVGDEVWSETGWTKVVAKKSTGVKDVYEYRTRLGSFVGTEDHRIVQHGEKIEVDKADCIDFLPVTESTTQTDIDTAVVNGLFLGDGTVRNGKPVLCVGEKDTDYYDTLSAHIHTEGYKYFREAKFDLCVDVSTPTYNRDFDVNDFHGYETSFLKGLFSANGSVVKQGNTHQITLTATSSNVANKVMWMLQSLGFTPRLYKTAGNKISWPNGEYQGRDRYDVKLCKNKDVTLFRETIGFLQKYKMDILNSAEELHGKNRSYDNAVLEKVYTGKYEVFHIEVDNSPHTYWTGGLNVSNCVLSSMNVALYDEWVNTDAIFNATVFLDCVASEFIERARDIPGLEKAVRFTEKARALGLGICGFATYIQSKGWSFGSLDTVYFNQQLFEKLDKESLDASIWMGAYWGYPEWAKRNDGTVSVRNCSRLAVAPTKSTALIMGGISEGINPDPAYVYTQTTAGGEVQRVAPELLKVMKEKKVYNKETLQSITDAFGSVQHVDWLTDEEKLVFRTAFEIDQHVLVRLASQRAKFLDQWQSVNLFFSAKEEPKYIAEVHKAAFEDENILGLYYIYSQAGIAGSKDRDECEACAS